MSSELCVFVFCNSILDRANCNVVTRTELWNYVCPTHDIYMHERGECESKYA